MHHFPINNLILLFPTATVFEIQELGHQLLGIMAACFYLKLEVYVYVKFTLFFLLVFSQFVSILDIWSTIENARHYMCLTYKFDGPHCSKIGSSRL